MAKKGGFLLGAVVGGTAAAIAALLLAPKSGKELRDELAAQADDLLVQLAGTGGVDHPDVVEHQVEVILHKTG